mmetsp:Transcript_61701/g.171018  ORF Transcript_61701/g.171018 Transcript_61701/m.171018 type:complete len:325 (+) Transcript_61701:186-1160(+)
MADVARREEGAVQPQDQGGLHGGCCRRCLREDVLVSAGRSWRPVCAHRGPVGRDGLGRPGRQGPAPQLRGPPRRPGPGPWHLEHAPHARPGGGFSRVLRARDQSGRRGTPSRSGRPEPRSSAGVGSGGEEVDRRWQPMHREGRPGGAGEARQASGWAPGRSSAEPRGAEALCLRQEGLADPSARAIPLSRPQQGTGRQFAAGCELRQQRAALFQGRRRRLGCQGAGRPLPLQVRGRQGPPGLRARGAVLGAAGGARARAGGPGVGGARRGGGAGGGRPPDAAAQGGAGGLQCARRCRRFVRRARVGSHSLRHQRCGYPRRRVHL